MASILLLEDDRALHKGIRISLEKDGHRVLSAYSYFEGLQMERENQVDLFLLDINLPGGSGKDFCRAVRAKGQKPVIFLTANDTEQDMLEGFQLGCDDYLAKPFSIEILRRRVLAVLRRSGGGEPHPGAYRYRELEVNFDKRTVRCRGEEVRLTVTEYNLLEYMIRNKGQVLTRAMLLLQIWDTDENYIDENTLSVHVRRLRQKIERDPKKPEYVITVFGIGYTFGE